MCGLFCAFIVITIRDNYRGAEPLNAFKVCAFFMTIAVIGETMGLEFKHLLFAQICILVHELFQFKAG